MSARLSICTKEEQRCRTIVLWAEGVKGAEIHTRLCAQYGDNALPRQSVHEQIEMFKNDRTSAMDAERSGRPLTSTAGEKQEVRAIILADRRVTIEEIASQLGISQGSAYYIVHDNLGFHKVSTRWVPRHLTEEHKRNRLDICSRLLEQYSREDDNFLNRIITGDENQKSNSRACGGSTRHLRHPSNSSRSPLPESSCWQCSGIPKAYP
jgi:hypothetical protein